jgi:D-sedoheptulose 7-phosphate isomerase
MSIAARVDRYFASFHTVLAAAEATDRAGSRLELGKALEWALDTGRAVHARGDKVMFIGNGGSSAIASHMSEDFSKAAGIRAMCFSDAATLTCLGNDYGYQHIYEKQIEWLGRAGDMLVAISSSGRSPNILKGVEAARAHKAEVLTLSGFEPDNPLRRMGDVNLYLPSKQYGFVEAGHLALLSAVVDFAMGWKE